MGEQEFQFLLCGVLNVGCVTEGFLNLVQIRKQLLFQLLPLFTGLKTVFGSGDPHFYGG